MDNEIVTKQGGKGLGITSFVLSLCGIVPCCIPYVGGAISFICSLLAMVFSFVSRSQNGGQFQPLAKAGFIISLIYFILLGLGIIAAIVLVILYFVFGISMVGLGAASSMGGVYY